MKLLPALLFCLLWLCSACAGPIHQQSVPVQAGALISVYVINHGWHTGLIVRRADIPRGLVPESGDFPAADYLELGWGDWDYYQSRDPGLWLALKALFWPTASVLHVVGVKDTIASRFAGYEIVGLAVGRDDFYRLVTYIHRSFLRDGTAKTMPLASGWGADSLFYPARGKFHLLNTCNSWTARALAAAGFPPGMPEPVTADGLMAKVRLFATTDEHSAHQD